MKCLSPGALAHRAGSSPGRLAPAARPEASRSVLRPQQQRLGVSCLAKRRSKPDAGSAGEPVSGGGQPTTPEGPVTGVGQPVAPVSGLRQTVVPAGPVTGVAQPVAPGAPLAPGASDQTAPGAQGKPEEFTTADGSPGRVPEVSLSTTADVDGPRWVGEAAGGEAAEVVEEVGTNVAEAVGDAEGAVLETTAQVSDAVEDVVESIPTPAEATQGATDAAADAIRQVEKLSESTYQQVSSTAREVQDAVQRGIEQIGASYNGPPRRNMSDTLRLTSLPTLPPSVLSGKSPDPEEEVTYLKYRLLASVSGLDRGFAATSAQAAEVETVISSLTLAGGPVKLAYATDSDGTSSLSKFAGVWRLVYSSAFASGSLGGRRPGPPIVRLPIQLGQVYQGIEDAGALLDNIVEVKLPTLLPRLPIGPEVEPIVATLVLKHNFTLIGPSTIQLNFIGTEVKATGGLGGWLSKLPEVTLPQLPESLSTTSNATFEVLYLDDAVRITRGDREELRVFVRT